MKGNDRVQQSNDSSNKIQGMKNAKSWDKIRYKTKSHIVVR